MSSLDSANGDPVRDAEAEGGACLSTDDAELVELLLAGDERAFASLVGRHHTALLRLAQQFVSSSAVAEEVVQETWMGVLRGLDRFEGRCSLKTWIFRILANRAKTRAKREARSMPFSSLSEGEDDAPAVDPQRFTAKGAWAAPPGRWHEALPEQRLLDKDTMALVKRTIEVLPPGQRNVVTLRDIEGLDASEVCNILDITETNQRVLLHRARSKLRNALERHLKEG